MNHFTSAIWEGKKINASDLIYLPDNIFKKCSQAEDFTSWGLIWNETVYVTTTTFWKMPLWMGKLTRPLGIMISAISITTFRQIHYLLTGLPSLAAKHCSRMEGERKTLNSAVLPAEKNWHCGSFFSLAKNKLLFPPLSHRTREGGLELHTVLNTTNQSPFSVCKSIFPHR